MPQTTIYQAISVPATADSPTIPAHILTAIQGIEERSVMRFATTTARDSTILTPVSGMTAWITGTKVMTIYDGTAWTPLIQLLSSPSVAAVDALNSGGQMTLVGAGSNKSWGIKSSSGTLVFIYDMAGAATTIATLAQTSFTLATGVTFTKEGILQPTLRTGAGVPAAGLGANGDWYAQLS